MLAATVLIYGPGTAVAVLVGHHGRAHAGTSSHNGGEQEPTKPSGSAALLLAGIVACAVTAAAPFAVPSQGPERCVVAFCAIYANLRVLQLACAPAEFARMPLSARWAHIFLNLLDARDCRATSRPVQRGRLVRLLGAAVAWGAATYVLSHAAAALHLPNGLRSGMFLLTSLHALEPLFSAANLVALGTETPRIMHEPWLSRSHQDFWGRRWNKMIQDLLFRCIFLPLRRRRCPRALAVLATFFGSGAVHALPLALHPQATTAALASAMAFFLAQGAFLLAEHAGATPGSGNGDSSEAGLARRAWFVFTLLGSASLVRLPDALFV